MRQKIQFLENKVKENFKFSFYDGVLTRLHSNFASANILAELEVFGNRKKITISEINAHGSKIRISDVLYEDICNILLEKNIYIRPKKINTMLALKKAIVISVLG